MITRWSDPCPQDWVNREAANMRILVVHALRLCQRATSSRSPRITFLKQFITKLLVDAGRRFEFECSSKINFITPGCLDRRAPKGEPRSCYPGSRSDTGGYSIRSARGYAYHFPKCWVSLVEMKWITLDSIVLIWTLAHVCRTRQTPLLRLQLVGLAASRSP